jgi:hypothetical protein
MQTNITPLQALPTLSSQSEDWATFYNICVKWYGKDAATIEFYKAWSKWGEGVTGSKANALTVSQMTGLSLDKSVLQTIEGKAEATMGVFGGLFGTVATGTKVILISAVGITVILAAGLTYRLLTASSTDIGTVAGVALKTAV